MKTFRYWGLLALWGASLSVHAGTWGDYIVGGTACNYGNTSVITNGPDLAVLFDEFNVEMDRSSRGDGLQARKTCNLRISVTPPRGFYLARLTQVISGGVLKSSRSSAQLSVRYNIGTDVQRPLPVIFPRGHRIDPEDFDSLFEEVYDDLLTVASCGGSKTFGINMAITAARDSYSEHLLLGVDSVDTSLNTVLRLIPEFRLCR